MTDLLSLPQLFLLFVKFSLVESSFSSSNFSSGLSTFISMPARSGRGLSSTGVPRTAAVDGIFCNLILDSALINLRWATLLCSSLSDELEDESLSEDEPDKSER